MILLYTTMPKPYSRYCRGDVDCCVVDTSTDALTCLQICRESSVRNKFVLTIVVNKKEDKVATFRIGTKDLGDRANMSCCKIISHAIAMRVKEATLFSDMHWSFCLATDSTHASLPLVVVARLWCIRG